jgi:hypothetical protein
MRIKGFVSVSVTLNACSFIGKEGVGFEAFSSA